MSATYLIGALEERRLGWYGAGFLLFTLAFLMEARTISLDMYVTAFTAWIVYFIYKAKLQSQASPLCVVALLLIMSFAVRGPIGMIIPAGVMCTFYLIEKDWKSLLLMSAMSLLLLLLCTGILLGAAYYVGGNSFMHDVLHMEVLGRIQENQTPPHYFYFVESVGAYAVTYPLAILVLLGNIKTLFKRNQFMWLLLGWTLIIMIGLSIPADKKVRYILPIAPALALICSSLFVSAQKGYLQLLKKGFYFICWFFPLLALIVLSIFYQKQIPLNYLILTVVFAFMQCSMLLVRTQDAVFFLALFTFFLANVFMVERANLFSNKTRDFVQSVENIRNIQHANLGFYHEGKDGWVVKYLINMQQEEKPLFIDNLNEMSKSPLFLVTSEEYFNALPEATRKSFQIIAIGKVGHDQVIVFANKPVADHPGAS